MSRKRINPLHVPGFKDHDTALDNRYITSTTNKYLKNLFMLCNLKNCFDLKYFITISDLIHNVIRLPNVSFLYLLLIYPHV